MVSPFGFKYHFKLLDLTDKKDLFAFFSEEVKENSGRIKNDVIKT
jgi:hypothetical protein